MVFYFKLSDKIKLIFKIPHDLFDDTSNIHFEDITKVAEELDCAFHRLEGLMRSTSGRRLMTVNRNGAVTTEGLAAPACLTYISFRDALTDAKANLHLQW